MSDISSGILSSISSGIVFGPRPTPSPGRWKIPGNTTAKTCSLSSKSPQKLQDMKPCMKVMQGVAEGKRTKQQDILKNKMKLSWMGSTNRTISENYCAAAFFAAPAVTYKMHLLRSWRQEGGSQKKPQQGHDPLDVSIKSWNRLRSYGIKHTACPNRFSVRLMLKHILTILGRNPKQ